MREFVAERVPKYEEEEAAIDECQQTTRTHTQSELSPELRRIRFGGGNTDVSSPFIYYYIKISFLFFPFVFNLPALCSLAERLNR